MPEWKKSVIKNEINEDEFDADMQRRLQWVLNHKFEQCYERMKNEWVQKLMDDPEVVNIPADPEQFVALVMARPDYKSRKQRDAEAILG